MKKKRAAFVMADSLVALLVASLAIDLVVICEQQLIKQQQVAQRHLAAARLGKEVSEQYLLTAKKAKIQRNNMNAWADQNGVIVEYEGQIILQVQA